MGDELTVRVKVEVEAVVIDSLATAEAGLPGGALIARNLHDPEAVRELRGVTESRVAGMDANRRPPILLVELTSSLLITRRG